MCLFYFLLFVRPSVLQIQKQNSLLNQYCTQQTLFIYCISSWLSIIMILMIIILSCICSISKATNWFVSVCYWFEIKCILAQSGILIKCGIVSQILFSGNGDLKSGDIQTFSGFWQKCYSLAFENWRNRVQAEILQHISNGRHNLQLKNYEWGVISWVLILHLVYWYIQCMHLLQKGKVSEVALEHIDPVRKLVKVAKSSELFRSIGKWGINAVRNRHPNYICTAGSKGNSVWKSQH